MREAFAQLKTDAERRAMPDPADLRVMSDRRAHARGVVGVLVIVALLVGGIFAVQALPPSKPPVAEPTPSASPTISPTPSPSSEPDAGGPKCADTYPKQLPLTHVLPDGVEFCFVETPAIGGPPTNTREHLPQPCPTTKHSSDILIEDRRGFSHTAIEALPYGPASTMYSQTVTKYRSGGAAQYLSELSAALASCGTVTRNNVVLTYTRVSGVAVGDESLYLKVQYKYSKPLEGGFPQVQTYLVTVVRVGDHISVIYDRGWEGTPSLDTTILDRTRQAVALLSP